MNSSPKPEWLVNGTKVFYKDASGLVLSYVETKDALHAREYVDGLVVKGARTTCLSIVRLDNETTEITNESCNPI